MCFAYCTLSNATFERELPLFIVRYIVLLILILVKECFPVTDLRNKDLVTHLRNKIRGTSRVTHPQKTES